MTWEQLLSEYSGSLMAAGALGYGLGLLVQHVKKLLDLL